MLKKKDSVCSFRTHALDFVRSSRTSDSRGNKLSKLFARKVPHFYFSAKIALLFKVLHLCWAHGLYDAILNINNRALKDYVTPLCELLVMLNSALDTGKPLSGKRVSDWSVIIPFRGFLQIAVGGITAAGVGDLPFENVAGKATPLIVLAKWTGPSVMLPCFTSVCISSEKAKFRTDGSIEGLRFPGKIAESVFLVMCSQYCRSEPVSKLALPKFAEIMRALPKFCELCRNSANLCFTSCPAEKYYSFASSPRFPFPAVDILVLTRFFAESKR